MIVDDREEMRALVKTMLAHRFKGAAAEVSPEIRVDTQTPTLCVSGNQAVQVLSNNPGRRWFVITDMEMPDGDGLVVVQYCLARGTPFLVFSAADTDFIARAMNLLGEKTASMVVQNQLLAKPAGVGELVGKVYELIWQAYQKDSTIAVNEHDEWA
jgi:CheY-like chemotaxis protein